MIERVIASTQAVVRKASRGCRSGEDSADDTRAFFSRIPFQRRCYAILSDYIGDALRVLDAGADRRSCSTAFRRTSACRYGPFKPTGYAQEHITHYTTASLVQRLTRLGLTIDQIRHIGRGEIVIKAPKPVARVS